MRVSPSDVGPGPLFTKIYQWSPPLSLGEGCRLPPPFTPPGSRAVRRAGRVGRRPPPLASPPGSREGQRPEAEAAAGGPQLRRAAARGTVNCWRAVIEVTDHSPVSMADLARLPAGATWRNCCRVAAACRALLLSPRGSCHSPRHRPRPTT